MFLHVATTEQIDKAKEVIKKLTFEFQSDSFENPGNQNTHVTTHRQLPPSQYLNLVTSQVSQIYLYSW